MGSVFYGRKSIYPFLADTSLSIYDYFYGAKKKDSGNYFSYFTEPKLRNKPLNTGDFNTIVNIDYGTASVSNGEINCYTEGWQLMIEVIPEKKIFSIPLQKEILNYKSSEVISIFQYDDYKVLLSHISGRYYKSEDSISIGSFSGYLFYNK